MTAQDKSFGYWLRRRRKALDLTQAELASRAGCALVTLKKIETGARQPSRQLAMRLADAMTLPADERAALLNSGNLIPISELTLPSSQSSALPASPNPLIGRAGDVAALKSLLTNENSRLVTLTGPGGVGKTRLALQIANELQDDFEDGVWFVDLAPLSDSEAVPAAIGQALGLAFGTAPQIVLTHVLRSRHALLVLDNFEQVLGAATFIAQLLSAAPHLAMLATSRAPLRLTWEREYPVAPLDTPPAHEAHALTDYAAVRLFLQRARAIHPQFELTAENESAIADICRRLDGLPLAIELAAFGLRSLTPHALLKRLDQRMAFLASPRDLPERQQTLHAALDWSYQLLGARTRRVFAQMGVFVGGETLEAIDAVCDRPERGDVLADVTTLIEHSLVRRVIDAAGEPRFTMLETIRAYALEQLEAGGDAMSIRARHAAFFLQLAEAATPHLRSPEQVRWLDALEADHDNLRAACDYFLPTGDVEAGLRLVAALHWFWNRRGYLDEGRARIRAALIAAANVAAPDDALVKARAWALAGAASLAFDQGDRAAVSAFAEESAALFRQLGNNDGLVLALLRLAFANQATDPQRAGALLNEALAHARASSTPWFAGLVLFVSAQAALFGARDTTLAHARITEAIRTLQPDGDPYLLAHCRGILGLIYLAAGDHSLARASLEEGLALVRTLHDRRSIALLAATTADVARCQSDYARAAELYSESMALYHELGNHAELPAILHNQGYVALGMNDLAAARDLFAESLRRQRQADNAAGVAEGLHGLAAVAIASRQLERAARLMGAAEAIRAANPAPVWPAEMQENRRYSEELRALLPASRFTQLWHEGEAFDMAQAIAFAVSDEKQDTMHAQPAPLGGLTEREREVAALIAQGATNRAIAEKLVISDRTVERHVSNIFAKLDFGSRTQIARFAVETGLVKQGTPAYTRVP